MSILDLTRTTVGDICIQALKDANVLGVGQTPLAEDQSEAWARLQWMFGQWVRKRYMIFHLVTYLVQSTGQITPYSVGPGGQIDTDGAAVNDPNWIGRITGSQRPNQIESAFFQQNTTGGGNLSPIVYGLKLYRAMEDYRRISLPSLSTFPMSAFYDPAFPLGQLYIWPWPNNPQYSVGVVCREQMPVQFPSLASVIYLPPEYYQAIVSNLAISLRPKYGIGTFPGDLLPLAAKQGMNVIRKGSTQIANLQMPSEIIRNGNYNIYSDQVY